MRACSFPLFQLFGRASDRPANAHIGGAAAQVSAHRLFDIRVRRVGLGLQQRDRAHDLPALAVAALDDIPLHPGALYRPAHGIPADAFDGYDRTVADRRYGENARARRRAAEMHRARTAGADPATVFRPGHLELFAQDPEKRSGRIDVYLATLAVDVELVCRHDFPFFRTLCIVTLYTVYCFVNSAEHCG